MQKKYSVNRIEIEIEVSIEFAAALRAFAAKLLQRRLEPSLLDSQRTKPPLVDVQRQFVPSLLYSTQLNARSRWPEEPEPEPWEPPDERPTGNTIGERGHDEVEDTLVVGAD
jgi:hypothetical protein